jgi:outer membrane lipopolysaccharide assembly protein LptE/RlpB
MIKKKFTLFLFLFLSSCGYEAVHSIKNSDKYAYFSISELTFDGNRDINIKIKQKLNKYTLIEKDKNFILRISSISEKKVLAKDSAGDPTSFKNTVIIKVEILMDNNLKNTIQITEDFNYNNISNKFDLKTYEREITDNLTEIVSNKLIFKLSNIR